MLTVRHSLLLLAVLVSACGARSTLRVDSNLDASVPDGAGPDGMVEGLTVECGRGRQFTTNDRPITLTATITATATVVTQTWELIESPVESAPVVDTDRARATLTPDRVGDYTMRFTARDSEGRGGFCEVVVESVVGPPVAICPEEQLFVAQNEELLVRGDAFDDVMVASYLWEIVNAPVGASPSVRQETEPTAIFLSDTLGEYVLRLTVTDNEGETGSCEVAIFVSGPPTVECPEGPIDAPTREVLTLVASASDDIGIASTLWEMLSRPVSSIAIAEPADELTTRMTPDRQGMYRLRFTATDIEGQSASCEVTVVGQPTPPTVTCPSMIETEPLIPLTVEASAEDDGTVVQWRWRLSGLPDGSDAMAPSPATASTTTFTPDIAGRYELTVVATDDDGMEGSCTTLVLAGNVDGLRVEMFWTTDGTDMDLHLLSPIATGWRNEEDCYYANCQGGLAWFTPTTDDDPSLDIDDTNGFGPENINILEPEPGVYRVGVHNFRGFGPNPTTVRVYCGGSTTEPRATFGPVDLMGRGGSSTDNDLWRVADVTISATGCTVDEILGPDGQPDVRNYGSTIDTR